MVLSINLCDLLKMCIFIIYCTFIIYPTINHVQADDKNLLHYCSTTLTVACRKRTKYCNEKTSHNLYFTWIVWARSNLEYAVENGKHQSIMKHVYSWILSASNDLCHQPDTTGPGQDLA